MTKRSRIILLGIMLALMLAIAAALLLASKNYEPPLSGSAKFVSLERDFA